MKPSNKDRWMHDRLVAAYWCGKMRAMLEKPSSCESLGETPRQLSLPGIWVPYSPPAHKR